MPRRKPFEVRIATHGTEAKEYQTVDPIVTGRQLIKLARVEPTDEHLIFMVLKDGGFEELRLDESVDLREPGAENFMIFSSSESFRLVIDGERYEWGTHLLTGAKLLQIARKDGDAFNVWKEQRDRADEQIARSQIVDLSEPGLERFYTRVIEYGPVTIIVNTRRKEVTGPKISFEQVIQLAYDDPPTGAQVCFTITYRRGVPSKPEGSLLEGQCVEIQKGMIFNVTSTDKS